MTDPGGWRPTHTIPGAGLWLWAEPDAGAAPTHPLDAGLAVQVVEERSGWARVVCANGFAGWVDARLLVAPGAAAAPAPAPARSRTPWLVAAFAALALVGLGIGVLAGGGDDGGDGDTAIDEVIDDPPEGGGDDTTETVVALNVPDGWTLAADGMAAAEDPADLDAAAPVGPVVRAATGEAPSEDELARALAVEGDDLQFTGPDEQTVSGEAAVVMVLRGQGRVQAFVAVHPPGRTEVVFTLDCPADRFDELGALLASVPGLG